MKYAVIKTGGKQYKVSEGDVIEVERIPLEKEISFDVLLCVDNDIKIGTPLVKNAHVTGLVLEEIRGPKIRVSKYKAKAKYRRSTGHRQALSKIKIEKIEFGKQEKTEKEKDKKTSKK